MRRRMRFGFTLVLAVVLFGGTALAQSTTTGGMKGVVRDESGSGLAGVTVVATSLTTQTAYSEITDGSGAYEITNLPPGSYDVMFYYSDLTAKRRAMPISLGKVTPVHVKLDTSQAGGEVIEIQGSAPTIDVGSTKQGVSVDQDYLDNIPVPGRTFADALGAAPGSAGDLYGVSFSGSSSLENSYIVDGVNTTGLNFGTLGGALINDFIQEIEIITGGYNAEFGRATGGVVNVVTKSGTNEFAGSVFFNGTTDSLIGDNIRPERASTSIEADGNLAYSADFGFELGGPIVKDKVWFYVGFAPRLQRVNIDRVSQRRIDCLQIDPETGLYRRRADGNLDCNPAPTAMGGYADGNPDTDLDTGFPIYEELDSTQLTQDLAQYQWVSKINFAMSPEHQGQLSVIGTPITGQQIGVRGIPSATQRDVSQLTTDLSAKWTSKFNDNKTEVEALVGWHRVKFDSQSAVSGVENEPFQALYFGDLYTWGQGFGAETQRTLDGCRDIGQGATNDLYPLIDNCPEDGFGTESGTPPGYAIGGIGGIADNKEERRSIKLSGVQRINAAGTHVFKGGFDVENNLAEVPRHLSGGAFYRVFIGQYVDMTRFAKINREGGENVCDFDDDEMPIMCDFFDGANPATGNTLNWSGFIQDSWQIRPNLTVNAGLRYEEQRLRYAKELQNTIDPITGAELGKNAMKLDNLWAPRLGATYDWTKEGRSKVYAHWGRFYESVPLRINERSFGGETTLTRYYSPDQCVGDSGDIDPNIGGVNGKDCDLNAVGGLGNVLFGSGVVVAPGVKPQFMDEIVIGAEYELLEDMRVGVAFHNRRLGRVLEDVSTDNAVTYIIANPGEFDSGEEAKLQDEIDSLPPGAERDALEDQLKQFQGIRLFDKAKRDYNALELHATKRFSRAFFIQAAYTYSRLEGNFPGLFSPDTGQLDPNITSQFDLIELLANRDGPLPGDRPHYFKFDGYYTWDFEESGQLTTGVRFRALSGTPVDALGRHYLYGFNESYLLPRGSVARTSFEKSGDIHFAYGRKLGKGYYLEGAVDIFNVVNDQGTAAFDEAYSFDPANPVVGGTLEDLVYLKQVERNDGFETSDPVTRNLNFGNTSARYGSRFARIGVKLTF